MEGWREGRRGRQEPKGRGLTKGLSSLGGGDGRPSFGRLPLGWVNTDPGQRGRAAKGQRLKTQEGQEGKNTKAVKRGGGGERGGGDTT